MPFHSFSLGCYARYWSTEDTLETQYERKRFYREIFTLDKWTNTTAYGGADQGAPAGPEQPGKPEEPVEPPADTQPPAPAVAPSEPPPKIPSSAPQTTPQPPPVIPPTSAPSPSIEPRVAIPFIEYRDLSYTY